MKFCVQPPIRHPFALANFQLGRKGQRPKGRKVKRPNFQKLSEAFLIKSKVVPDVFMSIFKLKGPISRNFALELIVLPLMKKKLDSLPWAFGARPRMIKICIGISVWEHFCAKGRQTFKSA